MSDDIKYVIRKLDKLDSRIDSIDITLAKQYLSLEEHIKRTDQNEEALEILGKESNERLKKLESSKDMIMGAFAILGVLASIILGLNELGFTLFK